MPQGRPTPGVNTRPAGTIPSPTAVSVSYGPENLPSLVPAAFRQQMSVFLNLALDSQCFLKVGVNAGNLRGWHGDENLKFPCQLRKLRVVSPQI